MTKTELIYRFKKYATLNNIVMFVAAIIVLTGVWSTIDTLQRNFSLQMQVNDLDQQIEVAELETSTLGLEQQYFQSSEYLELSARQYLGKATPGEKMIILPKHQPAAKSIERPARYVEPSNLEQWKQFFFGSS